VTIITAAPIALSASEQNLHKFRHDLNERKEKGDEIFTDHTDPDSERSMCTTANRASSDSG
jgi:hypothetical protein